MKVVALAGGVGGARLADGLAQVLASEDLTIIVNTGDDFEHLGLTICPDLDTVCYTLAGLANPVTGWGRANETWGGLETLGMLGGPTWFGLGDHDLGLHLERTRRIQLGHSLSQITQHFCQALGVLPRVLPMSDDPVRTWVYTKENGEIPFQEYFVYRQCHPRVQGFRFAGAEQARPAPGVLDALADGELIVICPSNPWVSVAPILAVQGIKDALLEKKLVAVSPIIGGQAVKGPVVKMYSELGIQPDARAVAQHYARLLAAIPKNMKFVIDNLDADLAGEIEKLDMQVMTTNILMKTKQDRARLAQEVLNL